MTDYVWASYPTEPNVIKQYLCGLWKKEYPEQCPEFLLNCAWEHKVVSLSVLCGVRPCNIKKAKRYLLLLREGIIVFPPLVCINGEVIDGLHRFWAYREAGFEVVRIYQNIPQPLSMKGAA